VPLKVYRTRVEGDVLQMEVSPCARPHNERADMTPSDILGFLGTGLVVVGCVPLIVWFCLRYQGEVCSFHRGRVLPARWLTACAALPERHRCGTADIDAAEAVGGRAPSLRGLSADCWQKRGKLVAGARNHL